MTENAQEDAGRQLSLKAQMILGDAVSPYHSTFDRLSKIAEKFERAGAEFPTVEVLAFFEGDGKGAGQDKQARDRRACAVRWVNENRSGIMPQWMADAGITFGDAAPVPPAAE